MPFLSTQPAGAPPGADYVSPQQVVYAYPPPSAPVSIQPAPQYWGPPQYPYPFVPNYGRRRGRSAARGGANQQRSSSANASQKSTKVSSNNVDDSNGAALDKFWDGSAKFTTLDELLHSILSQAAKCNIYGKTINKGILCALQALSKQESNKSKSPYSKIHIVTNTTIMPAPARNILSVLQIDNIDYKQRGIPLQPDVPEAYTLSRVSDGKSYNVSLYRNVEGAKWFLGYYKDGHNAVKPRAKKNPRDPKITEFDEEILKTQLGSSKTLTNNPKPAQSKPLSQTDFGAASAGLLGKKVKEQAAGSK